MVEAALPMEVLGLQMLGMLELVLRLAVYPACPILLTLETTTRSTHGTPATPPAQAIMGIMVEQETMVRLETPATQAPMELDIGELDTQERQVTQAQQVTQVTQATQATTAHPMQDILVQRV